MALNPFIWDRPLDDPSKIIGMEAFAHQVALTLKGQTNVALFGPRDTGKTTFVNQLALELAKAHGEDAPPFDVVKINLQRVVSIPGFIGCVHDAMVGHPVKQLRRAAQRQIGALEKEIGFDIKVIKGSVKRSGVKPEQDGETLHAQLAALRSLSQHLVVVFDEFQRLRHCPGDPLSIIRSALMSSGANHVSLLFTGSIRNALKMMLEDSHQPIFGEAARHAVAEHRASRLSRVPGLPVRGDRQAGRGAGARAPSQPHALPPAQHAATGVGDLGQHPGRRARHARGRDPRARPARPDDRAVRIRLGPQRSGERGRG